ncbi:MAG: hypothetical protein COA47_17635, partial [Robiginitomaculum sp.]
MANAPAPAAGPQLVFFGDSLTDSGNLYDAAGGLIEEEVRVTIGGATGSASDGITYAEYVSGLLDADPALNYAVAGAEAVFIAVG